MKLKAGHGVFFLFLIFCYGWYYTEKRERIKNEAIDTHLDFSIAKIKGCDVESRTTDYIYYYEGKKYKGYENVYLKSKIKKYFIVEISKINPELSRLTNKEVTDSTKIANSGFRKKTLDEILEMK